MQQILMFYLMDGFPLIRFCGSGVQNQRKFVEGRPHLIMTQFLNPMWYFVVLSEQP